MNELKVFSNSEFGELGVMLINGKEYFPANQCAAILGYAVPKDAIARHCKGALKRRLPTNGGVQEVKLIPEGDLYRLIVSSKLPKAEEFERWVFDEVLPQIRHNGGYIGNVEEIITRTATAVVSEVMKQILPLITTKSNVAQPVECIEIKRYKYKQVGLMETIPLDLRQQVDNMIRSARYSCQDIANWLRDNGVQVSQVTINKYAHKHFWDNSKQQSLQISLGDFKED